MKWVERWSSDIKLCDIIPRLISADEISRADWDHMTNDILYCGFFVPLVINLFIFVGN